MSITRVFCVEIDPSLRDEFEDKFSSISAGIVEEAHGCIRMAILKPSEWNPNRYAMISEWDNKSSLISFAGENWNVAVIPKDMEVYALEYSVEHFMSWG